MPLVLTRENSGFAVIDVSEKRQRARVQTWCGPLYARSYLIVIASVAKQSTNLTSVAIWIASSLALLAMTAGTISHTSIREAPLILASRCRYSVGWAKAHSAVPTG